jgi:hypothetical protein
VRATARRRDDATRCAPHAGAAPEPRRSRSHPPRDRALARSRSGGGSRGPHGAHTAARARWPPSARCHQPRLPSRLRTPRPLTASRLPTSPSRHHRARAGRQRGQAGRDARVPRRRRGQALRGQAKGHLGARGAERDARAAHRRAQAVRARQAAQGRQVSGAREADRGTSRAWRRRAVAPGGSDSRA